MKNGDRVRVYPHGDPGKAAIATVAILSSNERAIAVGFDSRPPFAIGDPLSMAVHPEHGIMLFASREASGGVPVGPWIEMLRGGHFEIEEAPLS
jgi:hypothetical protein